MIHEIRTDLALEACELLQKAMQAEKELAGVDTLIDNSDPDLLITKVKISSQEGEISLKKPIGNYVTVESPFFNDEVEKIDNKIINKTAEIIKDISHIVKNDSVLVVGLGNNDVTPDALRP